MDFDFGELKYFLGTWGIGGSTGTGGALGMKLGLFSLGGVDFLEEGGGGGGFTVLESGGGADNTAVGGATGVLIECGSFCFLVGMG